LPFSDTLGITDPNEVQTGRNVTDKFGITTPGDESAAAHGAGLLADVLLDPTGLAAGAAGAYGMFRGLKGLHKNVLLPAAQSQVRNRGSNLAFMGGIFQPKGDKALREAMDYIGPRHDWLAGHDILTPHVEARSDLDTALRRLSNPEAKRLYSELPPGSTLLNSGAEGPAFKTPYGSVIKVAPRKVLLGDPEKALLRDRIQPGMNRPRITESLTPHRTNVFGDPQQGARVEHMPLVKPLTDETGRMYDQISDIQRHLGETPELQHIHGLLEQTDLIDNALGRKVRSQIKHAYPELDPFDVRAGNVSETSAGRLVVHDPGAIRSQFGSNVLGYPTARRPPDEIARALLGQKSPLEVRRALKQMARAEPGEQGMIPPDLISLFDPAAHPSSPFSGPFTPVDNPMAAREQNLAEIRDFIQRHAHLLSSAI
jgi:hypothetical protein